MESLFNSKTCHSEIFLLLLIMKKYIQKYTTKPQSCSKPLTKYKITWSTPYIYISRKNKLIHSIRFYNENRNIPVITYQSRNYLPRLSVVQKRALPLLCISKTHWILLEMELQTFTLMSVEAQKIASTLVY